MNTATSSTALAFETRLGGSVANVRPRVEAALRAEGFGVLTEIDVRQTLKTKLGVDRPPFVILGACNPSLADRALRVDPRVGVLLPCNVVLREDGPDTIVEIMDPIAAFAVLKRGSLGPIADEARDRIVRVVEAIQAERSQQ